MVNKSTFVSRPQPAHVGMATVALILGIISIFMPLMGLVLGILAIIFGAIALHRKTTLTGPAIAGIITGSVALLTNIGIIVIVGIIIGGHFVLPSGTRDHEVNAQISEKKDFTINETAKMGPIDVKITNVQRNYMPTPDEVTAAKGNNPKQLLPTNSGYNQDTTLLENEVEYVRIMGTEQVNGRTYLGDNDLMISNTILNNVLPYSYSGGLERYKYDRSAPLSAEPFVFVYRIQKGNTSLILNRSVAIWKTIYPFVGTEGAPLARLTYTIALN